MRLLRLALAVGVRTERGESAGGAKSAAPSALWSARTRGGRIAVNPRHRDLPALIAEALDVLLAADWEGAAAARALGVTVSQIVKLLALHAPALALWNDERAARGLRPLHG